MKLQRELQIVNRLGLHARACAKLVKTANQFESDIVLCQNEHQADAKSLMGLMMLAATQGTRLTVITSGADAEDAMTQVQHLINNRFEEDE